jgi:hypothetical protein
MRGLAYFAYARSSFRRRGGWANGVRNLYRALYAAKAMGSALIQFHTVFTGEHGCRTRVLWCTAPVETRSAPGGAGGNRTRVRKRILRRLGYVCSVVIVLVRRVLTRRRSSDQPLRFLAPRRRGDAGGPACFVDAPDRSAGGERDGTASEIPFGLFTQP